jgi:hypothetical protein
MNERDKALRERLLNMEQNADTQQGRSDTPVRAILDRRLSLAARMGLGLLAGIGVWIALYYLELLQRHVPGLLLWPGLVFSVGWTATTAYLGVRGRLGSRISPSHIMGLGAGMVFTLIFVWTFLTEHNLLQANPQDWRLREMEQAAAAVLFGVVFVGLFLILRVVYRIEFKTQEKLLELELRLADLAEKIDKRKS